MPSYHARALVLRKTKLGETDLILTLLASDGRQLRAVAKGARKPGSRFGARTEPYSVLDMLLYTGRSLDVVTDAETVTSHEALRQDLDRATAASVVADLLDKVSCEGLADERLFSLTDTTLDAMESAGAEDLLAVVLAFLVKAMAMLGYRPQLHECAICASDVTGGQAFSLAAGGVLCPACGGDASAVPFSGEGRDALDALLRARMAEVVGLGVPPDVQRELFGLLKGFVGYHVPARLKALEYYAGTVR